MLSEEEKCGGLAPIILALIIIFFLFFASGCGGAYIQYGAWGGARAPFGPHYLRGTDCSQFVTAGARAACLREYNQALERARRELEYNYEREAAEYGRRGAQWEIGFPFFYERKTIRHYWRWRR